MNVCVYMCVRASVYVCVYTCTHMHSISQLHYGAYMIKMQPFILHNMAVTFCGYSNVDAVKSNAISFSLHDLAAYHHYIMVSISTVPVVYNQIYDRCCSGHDYPDHFTYVVPYYIAFRSAAEDSNIGLRKDFSRGCISFKLHCGRYLRKPVT